MSYANDEKTLALYDLDSGGTNLVGNPAWHLTARGDGTFERAATAEHLFWFRDSNDWTIEREVTIASAPGTILELAAWGETEAVNIQILVGWDEERRLYVGWERGDGMDYRLRSDAALPEGVPLRIAVVRSSSTLTLWANGKVVAHRRISGPTGGTSGGSVTPGMTLSVGRRVSTSDPQIYAGGGWLRISMARTPQEIRADWAASYSPPVLGGQTWEELARRSGTTRYYVFKGRFRAHADEPGETVEWATAYVDTGEGLYEARLLAAPQEIVRGIPEKPGAMCERASATIVLDNADGALTQMFAGGPDPETAHVGDSLLNLSGRIYQGHIDPTGQIVERPITPTLCAVGSPTLDDNGRITVQLATDDSRILGPVRAQITVEMLRNAGFLDAGQAFAIGRGASVRNRVFAIDSQTWQLIAGRMRQNRESVVPWAYGVAPIPLLYVGERYWLACVTLHEPQLSSNWELFKNNWSTSAVHIDGIDPEVWSVQVQVTLEDDSTIDVWVVGVRMQGRGGENESVTEATWYLRPPWGASLGMPSGVADTPVRMIRQIVSDLSLEGSSAIDTVSFSRSDREIRARGLCGGIIGSGATIAEIVSHICDAFAVSLTIGTDDQLHASRVTSWNADDAAEYSAGDLTRIYLPDIEEGSFSERHPAPNEVGGAVVRASLDWSSEQQAFYEAPRLLKHAPGSTRLSLTGEPEARVSAAWINADRAEQALSNAGSRRAFAYTHISLATGPWILTREIGDVFLISHPFGAADGGYTDRVARLIRLHQKPGEDVVTCIFIDMQALADMRVGVLDSAENWVYHRPGDGRFLQFNSGSAVVTCGDPNVNIDWIGRSLWTFGAPVAALRRSWRIVDVDVDFGTLTLDRAADATAAFASDGSAPAHRAPWIVMRNRSSDPDHRPQYITLADEETGLHSDGSQGFRFSS